MILRYQIKSKLGADKMTVRLIIPRGDFTAAYYPVAHVRCPVKSDCFQDWFDGRKVQAGVEFNINIECIANIVNNFVVLVSDGQWFFEGAGNKSLGLVLMVKGIIVGEACT